MARAEWTWKWVVGWFLIFLVAYLFLSAVVTALLVSKSPSSPTGPASAAPDGTYAATGMLLAALSTGAFLIHLVYRKSSRPWVVLGLRSVRLRSLAVAVALAATVYLVTDRIPGFETDPGANEVARGLAESASSPALLFLSFFLVVPAFEELLFRGYLLGALQGAGLSAWAAGAASVLAWCVAHQQETLSAYGAVALLGVLLGAIRLQTGSIVACTFVHVIWNIVVFAHPTFFR